MSTDNRSGKDTPEPPERALLLPDGESAGGPAHHEPGHSLRQLTWVLAWAVVFCDIGTSVYYVPGILYHQVGDLAPYFVALTTLGFLLLAQKYAEVSWRNREGGGVVTVATKAFGPWWGAFGGILITIDYFLTSAISSVSGFHYLATVVHGIEPHVVLLSCVGLVLLCLLNIVGVRESAGVALWMALASLVTNLITAVICLVQIRPEELSRLLTAASQFQDLTPWAMAVGFAGSWLAFSGLESISQLSPTLREPVKRTVHWSMLAVIVTIVLTSPILTALSVAVLPPEMKVAGSETFISDLASLRGGAWLKLSVVLSASALLLFAANTAMIGGYHVFLALAKNHFFPRILAKRNEFFSTPHWAILITTIVPLLVILFVHGQLNILGDMYSFGLLGAFTFTSLGLDVIRWRDGNRGVVFWVGILTTVMVGGSWAVNIVEKPLATIFGGVLTFLGLIVALGVRTDWFIAKLNRIPFISRRAEKIRHDVELEVEEETEIVSLAGAVAMKPLYHSSTLVAALGFNQKLMEEAIRRCKGQNEQALYLMSVTEWPGLFSGAETKPSQFIVNSIGEMSKYAREQGIFVVPVFSISDNAAGALADAARRLECSAVMLGVSQRSAIYHMLRGNVLRGLTKRLPEGCKIISVG
ncbi:MAG: APC family permease [Candidatus Eisenbacteria bacterium]|nr:APC family permease [Candidatus Eisenbacteria bacterium]